MRNTVLIATVAVIALGSCSAVAGATPQHRPPGSESIRLVAVNNGNSASFDIDAGSMTVQDGQFQIRDDRGTVIAGAPLHVNIDNVVYPVAVHIESHHATLTPTATGAYVEPLSPAAAPIAWSPKDQQEMQSFGRLGARIGIGAAVGALVGSVFAATTGCVLGSLTGAILTLPLATLLGGGPLAGCVVGATLMIPVGTLVGALAVGVPVAIAAAIEYFSTAFQPLPAETK